MKPMMCFLCGVNRFEKMHDRSGLIDPTNINRTFPRNCIHQALVDPLYCELNEFYLCFLIEDNSCYALLLVNTHVGNAETLVLHMTCYFEKESNRCIFFWSSWFICCLYPAGANQEIYHLVADCLKTWRVLDKNRDQSTGLSCVNF